MPDTYSVEYDLDGVHYAMDYTGDAPPTAQAVQSYAEQSIRNTDAHRKAVDALTAPASRQPANASTKPVPASSAKGQGYGVLAPSVPPKSKPAPIQSADAFLPQGNTVQQAQATPVGQIDPATAKAQALIRSMQAQGLHPVDGTRPAPVKPKAKPAPSPIADAAFSSPTMADKVTAQDAATPPVPVLTPHQQMLRAAQLAQQQAQSGGRISDFDQFVNSLPSRALGAVSPGSSDYAQAYKQAKQAGATDDQANDYAARQLESPLKKAATLGAKALPPVLEQGVKDAFNAGNDSSDLAQTLSGTLSALEGLSQPSELLKLGAIGKGTSLLPKILQTASIAASARGNAALGDALASAAKIAPKAVSGAFSADMLKTAIPDLLSGDDKRIGQGLVGLGMGAAAGSHALGGRPGAAIEKFVKGEESPVTAPVEGAQPANAPEHAIAPIAENSIEKSAPVDTASPRSLPSEALAPEGEASVPPPSVDAGPQSVKSKIFKTKQEADLRLAAMVEGIKSSSLMASELSKYGLDSNNAYQIIKTEKGWEIKPTEQHFAAAVLKKSEHSVQGAASPIDEIVGINADGATIYKRADGQFYKIRDGKVQSGGDLSPIEAKAQDVTAQVIAKPFDESAKPTGTGIRNADVEAETGTPHESGPVRTNADMLAQAKEKVKADPGYAKALTESVADNPRPLTDLEAHVLRLDKARMNQEHQNLVQEIARTDDPDQLAVHRAQLDMLEQDYARNQTATEKGGGESARGLSARRGLLADDLSAVNLIARAKVANPEKPVTMEERSKLEAASVRIAELEKQIADRQANPGDPAQPVIDSMVRQEQRAQRSSVRVSKTAALDQQLEALRRQAKTIRARKDAVPPSKPGSKTGAVTLPDPELAGIVLKMAKIHVQKGALTLTDVVDRVHGQLQDVYDGITKKDIRDILARSPSGRAPLTDEQRLGNAKARAQAGINAEQKRLISTGEGLDYPGQKVKRDAIVPDKELEALKRQRDALRVQAEKVIDSRRKLTWSDYLHRYQRFGLLSGTGTLLKLGAAAAGRTLMNPAEELFGGVSQKIVPGLDKVARQAPREGGFSMDAEVKSVKDLISRLTLSDMAQKIRTGRNSLDAANDPAGHGPHHPFWDFFGSLHGAIKTPAQRAEYGRSLEKRLAFAARQGQDLSDPGVQASVAAGAYADSKRAILLGDNAAVDAYKQLINHLDRSGHGMASAVLKTLIPIVRVPVNYAGEASLYAGGGIPNALGMLAKEKIASKQAKAKGESYDMDADVADKILRSFKKGGVGLGLLAYGYYGGRNASGGYYDPSNKDKNDNPGALHEGDLNLFGLKIPHQLAHTPALEAIHVGATFRTAMDALKGGTTAEKLSAGTRKSLKGLAEQVPFIESPVQANEALGSEKMAGKFAGRYVSSITMPTLLRELAKATDKDSTGTLVTGEPIKRPTRGFTDELKAGVPGLRKQIPTVGQQKAAASLARKKAALAKTRK